MAMSVGNNDLQKLLTRYAEVKTDAQKLKEVEGQIAAQLSTVNFKTLQTQLSPTQYEDLRQISGTPSFAQTFLEKNKPQHLEALIKELQPQFFADAQQKMRDAQASQYQVRKEQNATRGAPQKSAGPLPEVAASGASIAGTQVHNAELAQELENLTESTKSKRLSGKQQLLKTLETLQGLLTGRAIAAEALQDPLFPQALAHLSEGKSKLSPAQKAALDTAFPDKVETREKLREAFKGFTPEQQQALGTMAGYESLAATAQADKEMLASKVATTYGTTMTREQAMQLPESIRPAALEFVEAREKYDRVADATYNEIMGLLSSSMPIEVVIMLVMMRMSDRYEEKLRLKMKEVALAERLEKIERQGTDPSLAKLNMKSATSLNQELQAVMQQFSQMTQALQAVMRMLQDMTLTPIRNIR